MINESSQGDKIHFVSVMYNRITFVCFFCSLFFLLGNQTDSQNEEDGQGEETKAGGEGGGSDPSASLQDTR